jgi:hypothetical protein
MVLQGLLTIMALVTASLYIPSPEYTGVGAEAWRLAADAGGKCGLSLPAPRTLEQKKEAGARLRECGVLHLTGVYPLERVASFLDQAEAWVVDDPKWQVAVPLVGAV